MFFHCSKFFSAFVYGGTADNCAKLVQAFQKLIYVSNLVFGDASTFLLPWKRLFKVTDAQVIFFLFIVCVLFGYII